MPLQHSKARQGGAAFFVFGYFCIGLTQTVPGIGVLGIARQYTLKVPYRLFVAPLLRTQLPEPVMGFRVFRIQRQRVLQIYFGISPTLHQIQPPQRRMYARVFGIRHQCP